MINKETVRRWWNVFVGDGNFTEVRILGRFQYSGYYRSVENIIRDIQPYEEMADEQIYFTLNTIDEGCYGRFQCEKIVKSPKATTSDANIVSRRWVLIDFDPIRVSGTNSTDEEFELAHKKAQEVFRYLRDAGFKEPVICKSGNGWHLLFNVNFPNTDEIRDLLSKFLQVISMMFTDERVDIDEKVFNAARICKLYGTTAKKGANIRERPWRLSEIVYVPQLIEENGIELFERIASLLPKDDKTENYQNNGGWGSNGDFDLDGFLREHGIGYKRENCSKWTKYILDHCYFNPEHKNKDAAIFKMPNGGLKYVCQHNTCGHHTWNEFWNAVDPLAYKRNTSGYSQRSQRQSYTPHPSPVEIKQETEDIGKKWLSLDEIEDVNIDNLPRIKTGFHDIDYKLGGGLFLAETTIISGINGSGKSSWLNTLILNSIQDGFPTALWTGELQASRLKRWLVQAAAGSNHVVESRLSPGKYYVPKHIIDKISSWMHGKFLLYNNDYSSNYAQILNDMKEPVASGYKLFILDNLFAMSLDGIDGDENSKQKQFILMLVQFAKENNIHVILVAHPRKVVSFLRKEDILGSSALQNAVDNIFIIHRTGTDFEKRGCELFTPSLIKGLMSYGNVVEICKNREYGMMTEFIGLHYDPISRRFSDDSCRDRIYGWEAQPIQAEMTFDMVDEEAPF
jgi:archaellum biogenesis ATPase FlaH